MTTWTCSGWGGPFQLRTPWICSGCRWRKLSWGRTGQKEEEEGVNVFKLRGFCFIMLIFSHTCGVLYVALDVKRSCNMWQMLISRNEVKTVWILQICPCKQIKGVHSFAYDEGLLYFDNAQKDWVTACRTAACKKSLLAHNYVIM